uniref:TPX2 microtubule nucleation factor n=1 Tax=Acanthochromis polyacanthus TaxID=80966 RepID=A0A3Q1GEB5_9TELE
RDAEDLPPLIMADGKAEHYEFDAPCHVVDLNELVNSENDDKWFGNSSTINSAVFLFCVLSCKKGENVFCFSSFHLTVCRSPVAQKSRSDQLELGTAHEPHPATTSSANIQQSTSEEQELERIRNLQEEVALHRRRNEANYKAALAGKVRPKKMVLPTTVPKDFNFSTDKRAQASTSSNTSHKVVDFIDQLRKPSSPVTVPEANPYPLPFAKSQKSRERCVQVIFFFKHSVLWPPREKSNLKLTQPHPPHLVTQQRSRPLTVKSSADLEAEELEKLQNFKLKALELNKKILESAEDLKKPAVKEPTVPECFQLETEKRLQERQATKKPQEEEPHNFKAKPLPKKILEGVLGLPEKKVADPTVPESPAFALKKRVRLVSKLQEEKQISPVKAPPVPHLGLPFQPRLPGNHHVEVCPFSFEKREQEKRALKEKRLEEKQNEEVPQFKAQPLPDFDTVVLPEKKKQEPTKPEPFRFLVDERGAVKTSRWETMVKEEQIHQEEAVIFKAKPNTVTQKEPFRPKKEDRPGVVVEAFELATERRAREWQEYEQLTVEKEALRVRMETEQRQEEEQREKEEIARLRKEQVHRAQPIRHYKPVAVKKSDTPLTVPESPNFSARFRF